MSNSLSILLEKLGYGDGLFFKDDSLKINSRINNSLKYIDYDAIYIFDENPLIIFKQYNKYSSDDIKEFRKGIWNLNDIPIIFILLPDEIQVYSSNIFDDDSFLAKFSKTDELEIFNIYNLTNGTFFDKYSESFNNSKNVQNYLLDNIKTTIRLLKDDNLSFKTIHALIGKLIFSNYLADRGIYSKEFFAKNYGCDFKSIILNKDMLFDFLIRLEQDFNIDFFKLDENQINTITDRHLNILYKLFSGGDMDYPQTEVSECLYDFKIIPIELISNIYEVFLNDDDFKKNQKAIYTPMFLVDYILNNTLDVKLKDDFNCKVLDPSCGSGVFLVESLRRIIDRFIDLNSKITPDDLKKLLTSNIYGIDIDKDAIHMTILSIQLTLFDYLEIDEIRNFKMPKLIGKNLFIDDFFDLESQFNSITDFDLIVGNPPWGSKQASHIKYAEKYNLPVTNKQIAQSFLLRVKDFINPSSEVALIVSSKILYNFKDLKFRQYFLKNFKLVEVLEFSPIRKEIFSNAIDPGSILFYNSNIKDSGDIKFISLKPNRLFYLLKSVVVQKSDIKFISQKDLHDYDWVWKVLVYGSTLDFQLMLRLKSINTIGDFVKKHNLKTSFGILKGDGNCDASKYFSYDFLDTKKHMLQRYYVDESNVCKWDTARVSRPRSEEVFTPPYALVKKTLNKSLQCVTTFSQKKWVFTDSIMSIKGEIGDEKILKSIVGFLNSKLFSYWAILMFSSVGIEREQVFLNEIQSMPMVADDEIVKYVDKMLEVGDVEDYQNRIDERIFDLLSFSDFEKDLVNYFHDVTLPMYVGENVYWNVSNEILEKYIMIFVNYFKYYFREENNEYFHVQCYKSEHFVAIRFIISTNPSEKLIEYKDNPEILNFFANISVSDKQNLFIQKDIKGFEKSSFYVIKSNEFKNWHTAMARRDLLEFTNSLMGVED